MRRGHLLEWESRRYPRGQLSGVGELGELGQTLRLLERDGLVTRTITASVPVRVDYRLTSLGRTLLPVVRAIKDWSETHIAEVHAARAAYDHAARLRADTDPETPQSPHDLPHLP
jgi:DNA-binding PadR family transcriptional regulator